MKILKFEKYSFLYENLSDYPLNEMNMGFNQNQMGIEPTNTLGPGYGFAQDPTMSIYSDDSSPYIDNYARVSGLVNDLSKIIKSLHSTAFGIDTDIDRFLDDVDEFRNMKILRIVRNPMLKLDVFISFEFNEEEFFGVYKNFNGHMRPQLKSEFFSDQRMNYVDKEYYLKLNNYFYRILTNWFVPKKGEWKNLQQDYKVKNVFGQDIKLNKGVVVDVTGHNVDKDDEPYVMIKYKGENYKIIKNDYYFFKYYFEKID